MYISFDPTIVLQETDEHLHVFYKIYVTIFMPKPYYSYNIYTSNNNNSSLIPMNKRLIV